MTTLYGYWRSSAAYRVRIALNLKGVAYDTIPVNLIKEGGEHRKPAYAAINPQMRVPSLKLGSGEVLIQTPAILEWLEETHPSPPLLPKDPIERARVRAIVALICCDIHPLGNSGTLARLRSQFGADDAQIGDWIAYWFLDGLAAVEALIEPAPFAFGAQPTLADVCLVPPLFSARRFGAPLERFPKILAVEAAMQALPAVQRAGPAMQADAVAV